MSGRKWIIGLVLVAAGLLLLSRTLGFMFFTFRDLISYLLPILLIALGLWLLARSRSREQADAALDAADTARPSRQPSPPRDYHTPSRPTIQPVIPNLPPSMAEPGHPAAAEPSKGGRARYSKFVGDMFVDCKGVDLQNVEIGSFIGDVEIKLHGGKLAHGLNRMIVSGFIGDVRVLVPEGMAVFCQSSNFIGDIEMMGKRSSGFGNSIDAQTPNYGDAEAKLYIASNHFIGDVRVYVV